MALTQRRKFCRIPLIKTVITRQIGSCIDRAPACARIFSQGNSLRFQQLRTLPKKAFWLIVSALQILEKEETEDVRLLVIGGTAKTLVRLKTELATRFPEYARWILFVAITLVSSNLWPRRMPSFFHRISRRSVWRRLKPRRWGCRSSSPVILARR